MDSIIVGLVLLWLLFGLIFATHVAEREHKECAVLRARVAELENLVVALADSQQQQGTLIWGGDPVPVVTYPYPSGGWGELTVRAGSGGGWGLDGEVRGGSGGGGGIFVADGEDEAGREE